MVYKWADRSMSAMRIYRRKKDAYPAFNSDFVDHRWLSLIHYIYINIYMAFGGGSVEKTIHESFFTVCAS